MESSAEQAKVAHEAFEAKVMAGTATKEECTTVTDLLYYLLKGTFTRYYEAINANPNKIGNPDEYLDAIVRENVQIQMLIPEMFILRQKIGNPGLKCYRSMAIPCNHQHAIRPLHKVGPMASVYNLDE